jgi:hypothetical protein
MTAEGAATTGATVATTAFKKALISTGIGAFIVLIGSLVAYWDEVVSFFKKFATGAEDVKLSKAAVAALNGELDEYFGRQERFGIITSSAEKVKAAFTGMVEAFDKADKSKKNWGSLEMQPALEAVKNIKTLQDGYNVINKFGDILDEDLTQKIEQWAKYAKEHNDVLIEIDKDNEKSLSTGKRQIAANKEFNKAIAGTGISIKTTADAQKLYDDVRRGDVSLTTKQTLSLNKFIESIKTHTAEIAKLQKERDKDTNSAKKNADSIVERVDEIKSKIDEVAKSNEVKLKLGLALDTTSIPELRKMLEEMNEGGAGIDIKIKTDTGTARAELNKVIADEVAGWTNADKIKIESAKQVTVEKEIQAAEQEKLNEQMAIDDYNRWKQEQQLAKETADIIKKYNEQKAADEQEAFNATTGVASDSMKAIADLMEEGSAEAKAFTIASMITDTIQASFAAYKATVGIPIVGPALAPIAAATAAAAGAAAIKKIGGSAPAGDTATAASTPRATTPTTDQSLAGQYYLAGGIRDQRVVILASDIEDALNDRKVTTTN